MRLTWQQIASTVVSDILSRVDLDGVVLDTEHGCYSNETLFNCIQVVTGNKKKCFVRLTEVNATLIRLCLDAGADGLIFSTVETMEQSEKIIELCIIEILFPNMYFSKRELLMVKFRLNSL